MGIEFRRIQSSEAEAKWAESRPILRGMGMILLVTSFGLLVIGLYTGIQKYSRINHWTPADGLVLQFRLANEPHGRVLSNFRARYTFQYEVDGHTLVTSAQSDYTTSSGSELTAWSRDYRPGQHRQIRYNPAQPQEITTDNLDLRSFREPLWLFGWAAILLVVSLLLRR